MTQSIESAIQDAEQAISHKRDLEKYCTNPIYGFLESAWNEARELSELTDTGQLLSLIDTASRHLGSLQYGELNDYENKAHDLIHALKN